MEKNLKVIYRNNIDGNTFENEQEAYLDSVNSAMWKVNEVIADNDAGGMKEGEILQESLIDIKSACKLLMRAIEKKEYSKYEKAD